MKCKNCEQALKRLNKSQLCVICFIQRDLGRPIEIGKDIIFGVKK